MRNLRRHCYTRWVARMLVFLMLASYLGYGGRRVSAQGKSPLPVYVLDFNNKTKVGGALLGRVAAAQMTVELGESQNWDVTIGTQVQRRIQELGLKPPFGRIERIKIANGIDASAAIYGSIVAATVTGGPMPQAEVTLEVLVEDVFGETLINGARVTGRSTPRPGFAGNADLLLEEALGKAAFYARAHMDRFRLPQGTVLNTTVVGSGASPTTEVLINIGSRDGVRRGMEMTVTRQKDTVGKVRVTSVDAVLSTARVVESPQGVRPEDKVRAIFSFEDFDQTRSQRRSDAGWERRALSGNPGRAGDAVVGNASSDEPVQIARAGRRAEFVPFRAAQDAAMQLAQGGVQAPPPVVVDEPELGRDDKGGIGGASGAKRIQRNGALRMLVGGLLVAGLMGIIGRGGGAGTRAVGVEAAGFQSRVGEPNAQIRVTWQRPKVINPDQVVQYIIWRGDSLGNFAQVGAVDSNAIRSLVDNETARTFSAFDGVPDGQNSAGGRVSVTSTPLRPGVQYRYQVATAYLNGYEDRVGDGTGPGGGGGAGGGGGGVGVGTDTLMSPLSGSSSWATAVRPGAVTGPLNGQQVNIGELNVTFTQTPGANQYVIWVSSDPNFRRNVNTFGPFRDEVPVDQGGPAAITRQINASSNRLAGARNVFIAVGARSSLDGQPPVPRQYIFSAPISVQPETGPPNPPAGAQALGGGLAGKVRTRRP